ncbi:hypothetical protein ACEN9X_22555 [Mucilaginibacter sp. Mucisp86]|uniref:hypothetical protein n=1 Tax=Mucilaginibacter sp. Mucisp86 TaxID=3243060 RepID=UPI0039B3D8FB
MQRTAFILRETLLPGKCIALVFLLLIGMQHCLRAQASQNQTTLYEWNVTNTGSFPGERIVATINSGTIGTYTGAALVGQIIDGNGNLGYTLPIVANFKLFVNFTNSVYSLQQDVITPGIILGLKSISANQVAIVANCPIPNRQMRVFLRSTNGTTPTLTMGSPAVSTTDGTMLISQPTYNTILTGRLIVNVTDNTKTTPYAFAVGGNAIAEGMTVKLQGTWPDYVFKKDYKLPGLNYLKQYIIQNQHFPEMPSAEDVEKDGINVGEMNKLLLKKVEELTLYLIDLKAEVKEKNDLLRSLQTRVSQLEKPVSN